MDINFRPDQLSPLTLAFLGGAVYELYVRETLVRSANRPANDLHRLAVQQVKASAQASAIEKLLPILTEEEEAIYKRAETLTQTIFLRARQEEIIIWQQALKLLSAIFICRAEENA